MSVRSSLARIWHWVKRILLLLFLLDTAYLLLTRWVNPPITTVMMGSLLQGNGLQHDAVSLAHISPNLRLAVICSEDQLFAEHNGFDWNAIQKAMQYNQNPKHKKVKGASTISQQTAKNVFLWNGRNWFRKGLEVYHTFLIEWVWGKRRILENYLNVAEMGKGLFGAEAASLHYFHKHAAALTRSEAAWLAAILPNPVVYKIEKPGAMLQHRHAWIMAQMNNLEDDPEIMPLLH